MWGRLTNEEGRKRYTSMSQQLELAAADVKKVEPAERVF